MLVFAVAITILLGLWLRDDELEDRAAWNPQTTADPDQESAQPGVIELSAK